MAHTYGSCLYHFVFSTLHRRPIINPTWMGELWAYFGGVARNNDMKLLDAGGMDNHAHLLLALPPSMAPSKGIQLIKGNSSKWINDTFEVPGKFQWQEGFGVFTIGFSQIGKTQAYIQNQQEKHKKRTFEQEYKAFLRMHLIEFQDEYVFG